VKQRGGEAGDPEPPRAAPQAPIISGLLVSAFACGAQPVRNEPKGKPAEVTNTDAILAIWHPQSEEKSERTSEGTQTLGDLGGITFAAQRITKHDGCQNLHDGCKCQNTGWHGFCHDVITEGNLVRRCLCACD
jgi:hypothetical protein